MSRQLALLFLALGVLEFAAGCADSTGGPSRSVTEPTGASPTFPQTQTAIKLGRRPRPPSQPAYGTFVQLVEIGPEYRAEVHLSKKGELKLYTLTANLTEIQEVDVQTLAASVRRRDGSSDPAALPLEPMPQAGDSEGKTSRFAGTLSRQFLARAVVITVPITIERRRYRFSFLMTQDSHLEDEMPAKVVGAEEKTLFLTPGGKYTEADIKANGNMTPSQKYDVTGWPHDLKPSSGDKICPITLTKANPNCTWIIGGKKYEFCCPPCIDSFVDLAKTDPDRIKDPETYRKK